MTRFSSGRRRLIQAVPAALAASALARPAWSSESLGRPVHLIVPFAPGGPVDSIARVLNTELAASLGQNVIVDNRPGGGGVVALNAVTTAPADGNTMVLSSITLVTTPALMTPAPYDAAKDFAPLTVIGFIPHVLAVRAGYPAKTLADLVARGKAKPGSLRYGSSGIGTSAHLAGALFVDRAGLQATHVPYRGSAPAALDLLAGRLDFMFLDVPTLQPYLRAGQLRALAVAPAAGSRALPEVPTIAASGYPGFDIHAWYGMLVKAGTPEAVRQARYQALLKALNSDKFKTFLTTAGIDPGGMPPDQFAALIREDLASWKTAIDRLHISLT